MEFRHAQLRFVRTIPWRPGIAASLRAKPKLLDQVRFALRSRHYSARTEQTYVLFLYRYVLDRQLGELGKVIRARKCSRLPLC